MPNKYWPVKPDRSTRLLLAFFAVFHVTFAPGQVNDTLRIYKKWENAIAEPEKVFTLSLTKAGIKELEEFLPKFTNLQRLELVNSRLTRFPEVICTLKNLRMLNLGNNEIDTIPDCICKMVLLEEITLWDNNIYYLPDCLAEMPRLKTIDLTGINYNQKEQDMIRERFPAILFRLSEPCNCNFE